MNNERVTAKHDHSITIAATVVLQLVLVASAHPRPSSPRMPVNTAQLLSAFSGEDAARYEPLFQFSRDSRILDVEIYSVANHDTTARYSGQENAWHEVNNILRVTTADGFEGVSGVETYYDGKFCDELLSELQGVIGDVMVFGSVDPMQVGTMLAREHPDLSDEARSSIDIALWDLAARRANLPLYHLLGAKRDSIEPYASLPFYESLPEYVAAVNAAAELGFTAFKFHAWGDVEQDLRLVELVQQTFADSAYRFMIDLESAYDLEAAFRLGEKMDEGLFIWFEAPVDDKQLRQYASLKDRLRLSIIPAGYENYSQEFMQAGIAADAWDAGRFDATVVGGITPALKLLAIANKAGLPIEIQSWGHSLTQVVNLHLMLANELTQFFEAAMPNEIYEFGMKNGNLLKRNRAWAPAGPGLGIDVDWLSLEDADFYRKSVVDNPTTDLSSPR